MHRSEGADTGHEHGSPVDVGNEGDDGAVAIWSLFLGLALLLAATGLAGSLIGLEGARIGFPTWLLGLMAAMYYVGFLAGSRLAVVALARVGHIRVYAGLAGTATSSLLMHAVTEHPAWWVSARFFLGLAMAGQYVVAESWLNGLAGNERRGRLLGLYLIVCSIGISLGQALLAPMSVDPLKGFVVAGFLTSIAAIPVTFAESSLPRERPSRHISMRELARTVPTGFGTALLVGAAHGILLGMAAFYGATVGMSPGRIAWFVALPTLGQVVFQWPISSASDDLDRRVVGFAVAVLATVAAWAMLLVGADDALAFVAITLVGGMSYPLYGIAVAVTNDWVEPDQTNAVASQLITLYGVGAAVGPLVAGAVMGSVGAEGYVWSLVVVHAITAVFVLYRLFAWRAPIANRPWSEVSIPARAFFVPATVAAMGRRAARKRRRS